MEEYKDVDVDASDAYDANPALGALICPAKYIFFFFFFHSYLTSICNLTVMTDMRLLPPKKLMPSQKDLLFSSPFLRRLAGQAAALGMGL